MSVLSQLQETKNLFISIILYTQELHSIFWISSCDLSLIILFIIILLSLEQEIIFPFDNSKMHLISFEWELIWINWLKYFISKIPIEPELNPIAILLFFNCIKQ